MVAAIAVVGGDGVEMEMLGVVLIARSGMEIAGDLSVSELWT